ncbi:MAG TPA: hypothetical protein VLD64_08320 [Nitrosarchaeum sp.]|jgi:hypothetical protein|nr:hypothetical protein [Nitrosarchaeum sp.]
MSLKKFISDSKMFEYDRHYRECQQNDQPFIKARKNPNNGNYYVQIDFMTCNYNLTVDGKNQVTRLFENEIAFLDSASYPKSSFNGYNVDKELAWFDGVLPNRLDSFCEELFELSQNFHD